MTAVRVLTVRQPHAWALVAGRKDVENRTRPCPVEPGGLLAILAGLKFTPPLRVPQRDEPDHYVHGAIIGAVRVVDSHPYVPYHFGCAGCSSSWALREVGQHHWVVSDAVMLDEPIPMRGTLSVGTAPEPVRKAVLAAQPVIRVDMPHPRP